MTCNDNMRFIARIYNKPFEDIKDYVNDFAEFGKYLTEAVKIYSIGMRARLRLHCRSRLISIAI
jgi:capsular polysaccharide transport system ATP-binding protein